MAIVAFAAVLRSWQLAESLWIDELHSSWTVGGDWMQIAPRAALGNQPPLYFYLAKLSTSLFGQSEAALRLPSLIAGIGAVALPGVAAWRISRSMTATLLTLLVAAVDHELLFYGGEARSYAIIQLLAVIHWGALLWLLGTGYDSATQKQKHGLPAWAWWLIWVASGALIISLHLLFASILAIDGMAVAGALLWQRASARPAANSSLQRVSARWLMAGMAVMTLAMAPNYGLYLDVARRREQWKRFISDVPSLADFFTDVWPAMFVVFIPAIAIALSVALRWWRRGKNAASQSSAHRQALMRLGVLALAAIGPVIAAWIFTLAGVAAVFHPRYFAAALPAFLLLPAALFCWLPTRSWRIVVAVIIGAGSVWFSAIDVAFYQQGRFVPDRNEDWRAAVHVLNHSQPQFDSDSPVLVYSGLIEADALNGDDAEQWREYCSLPIRGIYQLDGDRPIIGLPLASPAENSEANISSQTGFSLLVRGPPSFADELAADFASLDSQNFDLTSQTHFGNVSLYQFRRLK